MNNEKPMYYDGSGKLCSEFLKSLPKETVSFKFTPEIRKNLYVHPHIIQK